MTQVFSEDGDALAVTVVELLPMIVTQLKTKESDGYFAVQVGYVDAKAKHLTKGQQGHLSKNDLPLLRKLKEFRVSEQEFAALALNIGDKVDLSFVNELGNVSVSGQSIGKGFQGDIKRWNHHRGPMTHGSKSHRIPGSIGAGTTPGRVVKGKQMPGNMGHVNITTKNLKVVRVLEDKQVMLLHGSVPGVEGTILTIESTQKAKQTA